MMIMTDILEIIILIVGFIYWPLLYIRLHNVFYGYSLTKIKIVAATVFTIAATLVLLNFNVYSYQDPYTLVVPLLAIVPVVILAIGKAKARRTNIKIILLAAYFHIFWQVLPKNIVFIFTDLIGIAAILVIIKTEKEGKIKKPSISMPKAPSIGKPRIKIKFPSIKLRQQKHFINISKIKPPKSRITKIKINLRDKLRKKKKQEEPKPKKETKEDEEKPISIKDLWSN